MKKAIIFVCLIGPILLLLDTVNAVDALMLFLFAGLVPGTDIRITPISMMSATATAITTIVLRLTVWPRLSSALFLPAPTPAPRKKRASRRTA